jgi:hypothetical protein
VAVAVIRGLVAAKGTDLGNFWVDLTRSVLWFLLPPSVVLTLFVAWQGVPQTLQGAVVAAGVEGQEQVVARGPVAAQTAIKQIGTNGGSFFRSELGASLREPDDRLETWRSPSPSSSSLWPSVSCSGAWREISVSTCTETGSQIVVWKGSPKRVGELGLTRCSCRLAEPGQARLGRDGDLPVIRPGS